MINTHVEIKDWPTRLTGEMLLMGLLGKMVYSEPEEGWIKPLLDEEIFAEVPLGMDEEETLAGLKLLYPFIAAQQGQLREAVLQSLKGDYMQLFIGPGRMKAPVWESVYFTQDHLLFQEGTLDVRRWYRRFGLEAERLHREPDDHLGLELSFIAHLAGLALQALEQQDSTTFMHLMNAQRDFCRQHLLRWGPTWAHLVMEHARTDFYRGLGHLVLGSLNAVARLLQLEMPAQDASIAPYEQKIRL